MATQRTRGLAAVLAGAFLLGFSAIFVRWAEPASPVVIGFYRMLFSLPCLVLMAWNSEAPRRDDRLRGYGWALLGGLFFTTDLTCWHAAMHFTSAANATLLVGMAPLWVNLFAVLFLGTRLKSRAWLGLGLALAGAALLALAKGARFGNGEGERLACISSLCYAGYTLALGRARRHLSAPRAVAFVSLVCSAAFTGLVLLRGERLGGFPLRTWGALLALGLVVQAAAWWLVSRGLGHVRTNVAAVILLLQPVATVFLGWGLLREGIRPLQGFGTAVILAGIALAAVDPERPRRGISPPARC